LFGLSGTLIHGNISFDARFWLSLGARSVIAGRGIATGAGGRETSCAPACNSKTGGFMQVSHFINRPEVEHPKCGKCGVSMWLARIEPDKPDFDKRTYECPVCENVVAEIVKYG
jgi:hypothetical protein